MNVKKVVIFRVIYDYERAKISNIMREISLIPKSIHSCWSRGEKRSKNHAHVNIISQ